jgi:uncharacterized membrane protein
MVLVLLSFAVGAYSYALLPQPVASHWGLSGEANGYMPKIFGAFLFPGIMAALFVIFSIIPIIDPLRANIDKFRTAYFGFALAVIAFMFIIYVQTILWNLGTMISFNLTIPILLGGLFFCVGLLLDKVKRNWFIGIRTPWTLSSDEVWDKTHKFGAMLFKVAGILMLFTLVLPAYTLWVVLGLVLIAALAAVVYSYVLYTQVMKKRTWKRGSRKARKAKKV